MCVKTSEGQKYKISIPQQLTKNLFITLFFVVFFSYPPLNIIEPVNIKDIQGPMIQCADKYGNYRKVLGFKSANEVVKEHLQNVF